VKVRGELERQVRVHSAIANTIAVLLFEDIEKMDFVDYREVFTAAVDGLTGERAS